MKLTFNTMVADLSVALSAIDHYQAGRFTQAINDLQSVLDFEPTNWDARLMLGACFYKTQQWSAAHRTFDFIASKCSDSDIRTKAQEAVQVTTAKLNKWNTVGLPLEFGCDVELQPVQSVREPISWLR
ncbi:MAG: tetratricopeptide repeat protein [Candidatus Obscuribacterales bacterium]|nr:tetratricopeptide repeat protein [Candidatus Obscuribacterales bacterium]